MLLFDDGAAAGVVFRNERDRIVYGRTHGGIYESAGPRVLYRNFVFSAGERFGGGLLADLYRGLLGGMGAPLCAGAPCTDLCDDGIFKSSDGRRAVWKAGGDDCRRGSVSVKSGGHVCPRHQYHSGDGGSGDGPAGGEHGGKDDSDGSGARQCGKRHGTDFYQFGPYDQKFRRGGGFDCAGYPLCGSVFEHGAACRFI